MDTAFPLLLPLLPSVNSSKTDCPVDKCAT